MPVPELERPADGVHALAVVRHVAGEVIDEVVLESQPKPRASVNMCASAGVTGPLGEKRAERLALVEPERRDVDEADDVRRLGTERGHDLAAVGVSDDDRRTVLELEHLTQAGDVVGERAQRELRRSDLEAVGLQALDDAAPARPVGPCAMDENDVRSTVHFGGSLLIRPLR